MNIQTPNGFEKARVCAYDTETLHLFKDVGNRFEKLGFACGVIVDMETSFIGFYRDPIKMIKHLIENYDIILGFNNKYFDNTMLGSVTQPFVEIEDYINKEIPFGKYKGMKWDMIPKDYLIWLINEETNWSKVASTILAHRDNITIRYELTDKFVIDQLNEKSIDLFEILSNNTGVKYPSSLDDCCRLTINKQKTDGLSNTSIPELCAQNKWDTIEEYQINDGDITKELFQFILDHGYCLIPAIRGDKYQDVCIKIPIDLHSLLIDKTK
jgi:hypothetical protein